MKRVVNNSTVNGLKQEILLAWDIANEVYQEQGNNFCDLTCGTNGKHSLGSLHFVGYAIDLRTKSFEHGYVGVEANRAVAELRERLGVEYDVVLESNHIHLEFQPKNGINL